MTLYHYCSNSTFCSIINSKSIWLSSMSLSNDTMEGKWLREIMIGKLRTASVSPATFQAAIEKFDLMLEISDRLGFCLSEKDDLLSQWRGYAEDGAGVSIGFAKDFLQDKSPSGEGLPGWSLHKVTYDMVGPESKLSNVVSDLLDASARGVFDTRIDDEPSNFTGDSNYQAELLTKIVNMLSKVAPEIASLKITGLFPEIFTIKNPAFIEEHEWRLLTNLLYRDNHDDDDNQEKCSYRAGQKGIVPYRVYTLPFGEKTVIEQVVLGPKNTSKLQDVEKFLRLAGLKDVEVKRSEATYR